MQIFTYCKQSNTECKYLHTASNQILEMGTPGNETTNTPHTVTNLAFGHWSPEELQALQEAEPDSVLPLNGSAIATGNECMGG